VGKVVDVKKVTSELDMFCLDADESEGRES